MNNLLTRYLQNIVTYKIKKMPENDKEKHLEMERKKKVNSYDDTRQDT